MPKVSLALLAMLMSPRIRPTRVHLKIKIKIRRYSKISNLSKSFQQISIIYCITHIFLFFPIYCVQLKSLLSVSRYLKLETCQLKIWTEAVILILNYISFPIARRNSRPKFIGGIRTQSLMKLLYLGKCPPDRQIKGSENCTFCRFQVWQSV